MATRSGMTGLIVELRGMTEADEHAYEIGPTTYWTDQQMQDVLDLYRVDVYREELAMVPKHVGGGTVEYYEFYSQYNQFEQTTGGSAVFWVEDGTGTDQGTANYSVDYRRGVVTFTADQGGSARYLTGRSYDLNAAAADIWRRKASHVAQVYDFSTDGHSMSRSQLVKHYLTMASTFEAKGPVVTAVLTRSDVVS